MACGLRRGGSTCRVDCVLLIFAELQVLDHESEESELLMRVSGSRGYEKVMSRANLSRRRGVLWATELLLK